ncbi:GH92 family glycosyl hydrolase [Pedobacter gandavensis]|uniref:GH92 family glycosyl hydrolase n=1 Tax=Pedobacter gandavensis TaxID=2679963 RepID=UPI002930AC02|nr:GH92 family glycosyl hydrolase [Pedobacter gandavensis]
MSWDIKKWVVLLCFSLSTYSTFSQSKILWKIGNKDHTANEFALASNSRYTAFIQNFGGENLTYSIGYSQPEKHWSYVLPGALDSWAGGGYWAGYYPRHFPGIFFQLNKGKSISGYQLVLNFADVNSKAGTVLMVDINGHKQEYPLKPGSGNGIKGDYSSAKSQSIRIPVAASWIREGMNKIQLANVKGSWAVFDNLEFYADQSQTIAKASSSLIVSADPATFEIKEEGKRIQPLLIDIHQIDHDQELKIIIDGLLVRKKLVETGHSILEIPMSAVNKDKVSILKVVSNDQVIYSGKIKRAKQHLHRPSDDVDLLMGTGNSRWMFKPGPSLPFSMVQIAPDNQDEIWKAGYEYTVDNIMGFSHFSDWTMSGLLLMPTSGPLLVNPGTEEDPDSGYRSRIDKKTESAKVGKYSVFMTDTKIKAEISATRHAAIQRYTFPKLDTARILIDLFTPAEYPQNLVNTVVTKQTNQRIEGHATYYNAFTGYSLQQQYTLYFVLEFDKPFESMGGWVNEGVAPVTGYINGWNRKHEFNTKPVISHNITSITGKGDAGVFLNFKTKAGEQIQLRSGVSLVDMAGARNNLHTELSTPFGWNFEKVVENARNIWDEYLGRIEIETDDRLQKKKFYTNLYRAIGAKVIWTDVDGRYVDENEEIKKLEHPADVIVSGEYWNTFWNNQQLFNLVAPEMSSKWARSAISLYKNSGWFNTDPAGVEHTGVMVAMHLASQIQSAWQSGIRDFDLDLAYTGLKKMLTTAPEKYKGGGTVGVEDIIPYMKYGYIPAGMGEVSNTMEYAFDDWTLSQMALSLNRTDDYQYFLKRSESWKNLMDSETGFIRPKDKEGKWINPFDPFHTPGFVEGNAFNYTWFVPHDPGSLISMMGKDRFVERLNGAMEKSAVANFNAAGDNFELFPVNHGNQPTMQVSYLFNWAKAPWLTQKWARAIQEQYYGTTAYDAYLGDEDLGQMSSWFIMSALGLFQMDGGTAIKPAYELGSPRYPKATIKLNHQYNRGAEFIIEAKNASKNNKYIQSATLNGKPIQSFRIPQSTVLKGGRLVLTMAAEPNKQWGLNP